MSFTTGVLLALAASHVQEPWNRDRISGPEDGGGKMEVRKSAESILNDN